MTVFRACFRAALPAAVCCGLLPLVPAAFAQTSPVVPSARVTAGVRGLPASVLLHAEPQTAAVQRLRVVNSYRIEDLRARPVLQLGGAQLNFAPVLRNPKALFNVAQRLKAMPQHVEVHADTTEVNEVEQGLLIHHVLGYKILPGKCADAAARQQLAAAGVGCFQSAPVALRLQGYSTPGDARYVADPVKRQKAVALYQANEARQEAEVSGHIAALRKQFNDPAQRAQFVARFGADETERVSRLDDDQLKSELINSSEQHIEQTMFIPNREDISRVRGIAAMNITPAAQEVARQRTLMNNPALTAAPTTQEEAGDAVKTARLGGLVKGSAAVSQAMKPADQVTEKDLGTFIYLTGFTLGRDYEWKQGVSVTINWCWIGCSSTYSADVYAGFNYGLGLRFPIRTHLGYKYVRHPDGSDAAFVKADFVPINGTAADYQAAGMDPSGGQIFDGKEFVAQIGADAGVDYDLPIVGSNSIGINVGYDFTAGLPAPFTNGQFTPPAPGTTSDAAPIVFDNFDLLQGYGNFGVLGGQVFPAIQVGLHSDKLQFTLTDAVSHQQTAVTATGRSFPLAVGNDPVRTSTFSFANPVYNLGFVVTPGLDARLFVDLAVWSDHWDWMVWFPQLTIELPPGGVDFGCHAGTICSRSFQEHGFIPPVLVIKDAGGLQNASQLIRDMQALGCRDTRPNDVDHQIVCPTQQAVGVCKAKAEGHKEIGCVLGK